MKKYKSQKSSISNIVIPNEIKATGQKLAAEEQRSFANFVVVAIVERIKRVEASQKS